VAGRTVWTLTQSDSTSYLLIRVRVGLFDAGSGGNPRGTAYWRQQLVR
jgi:hypothetical protein